MFRNAGDSDFRMTSVAETIRFSKATVQIQQFKYERETYKQQGHRLRLILVFKIHEIRERTCRRPTTHPATHTLFTMAAGDLDRLSAAFQEHF